MANKAEGKSVEESTDKPIKKRRGRPPKTKEENPSEVVETPFGHVIKNLEPKQKKVLDQLLLNATDASQHNQLPDSVLGVQGKQLPQHDIKKDHLLIKGINLSKNMQTGAWEISEIDTNQGRFGTGAEQTSKLDQKFIRSIVKYLKNAFEEDLKAFLQGEDNE